MDISRTVVVTGGSRGWGRGIVERFARPGTRIFINYRSDDGAAEEAAEACRTGGGEPVLVKADMAAAEGVDELFGSVAAAGAPLDVLVYNAFFLAQGRKPMEVDVATMESCFTVGPVGFLRCVQSAVPLMKADGGRIIRTGSVATTRLFSRGGTGYFPMAVAKGAEEVMVRYLAVELGTRGITVNLVAAGWIATEPVRTTFDAGRLEKIRRRTPLDRALATVEEMSDVVHFLASPEGSWITGQVVTADGGLTLI